MPDLDEHLKIVSRSQRPPISDGLPAPDEAAPLPTPGDPYKAASMPSNHPLTRLCCVMGRSGFKNGAKAYRFFQYANLDSDGDFGYVDGSQQFTLRIACRLPKLIIVEGRNLLRICDYIQLHRQSWIRMADRDFGDDGLPPQEPLITSIRIEEWTPDDREN